MNTTITAVLAVKNEAAIIENALQNLQWVDEIIIIDNGSTDTTKKIAKKYTKKVYAVNKPLLIPELQQKGIGKTTADWVIVLDADVLVPKEAQKEILEKITDSSVDGYYLRHKNYFLGKPLECHFGEHKILKLFRNGKAEFEGKHAHEAIMFTGRDIGTIENFLIHNAHPSISVFLRKANLYSSQDAKKLAKGEKAGIAKRGMVDPGFYEFIISPVLYFLNFYLRRGAYKDGLRGLILSVLFSYYIFLETAKVFEIKNVN